MHVRHPTLREDAADFFLDQALQSLLAEFRDDVIVSLLLEHALDEVVQLDFT